MGSHRSSSIKSTRIENMMLPSLLLLMPAFAFAQRCPGPEPSIPSGACCPSDGFFKEEDTKACSFYYDCVKGTVTHKQCEPLADGLARVYDTAMDWCAYRDDVDCGSRPCNDEAMSATQPAKTTTTTTSDCGERPVCDECDNNCDDAGHTTTEDCGHFMDCTGKKDGWYEDDANCRKYWHCSGGHGSHMMCDTKEGKELLYNPDLIQCDFPERVDCGDRQVCDECDKNCHPNACKDCNNDADCGPADHHPADICVGKRDGWYPDLFNCAKYWHCDAQKGTHFLCANGLVYEPNKVQCDWPDRVNCGNRPTCDQCDENCHW